MESYQQDGIVKVHEPFVRGWGRGERRQSDVSACSRAKGKENVTIKA